MFCPNCASQNDELQHYCRMCGIMLDAIAAELMAQKPSPEMAELLKRKTRIQKLGVYSLAMFLLASVFFFNYPKFFMEANGAKAGYSDHAIETARTNKLLKDPPFEPATVTEHSTELLRRNQ